MNNKRTTKAVKYLDSHTAKKCIINSSKSILKHLEGCKYENMRIPGNVATFLLVLCRRFRAGFTVAEYKEILNSLTADNYTDKQIKFYDWV